MKNLIALLFLFAFVGAKAQSIVSVIPTDGTVITEWDNTDVRIQVSATVDVPNLYAAVFSVDPIGKTKVLNGKNDNKGAAVTFPSSNGDYKKFEIIIKLASGIKEGEHTLRVDLYGKNFRDLVDSREITFSIKYIQ